MTRAEHVAWAKQRALEYVQTGDLNEAVASMMSDMGKHPETRGHLGNELAAMLMMSGQLKTRGQVRNFIEGYN